ncbi:hypothetical protein DPMN_095725 [Dreissena polymorpha]|uniref:Uncharacterized protein n=1 Tax=Dreissena polymorpha TaxID=45954 RepID=A0A9D4L8I3_DREPO|nr:hypothetical protein DPMN_095725 [Dreissena polymorpha]
MFGVLAETLFCKQHITRKTIDMNSILCKVPQNQLEATQHPFKASKTNLIRDNSLREKMLCN